MRDLRFAGPCRVEQNLPDESDFEAKVESELNVMIARTGGVPPALST